MPDDVVVAFANNEIKVDPRNETKKARALWGMSRSMVNNLVTRRVQGLRKEARDHRVGYKAAVAGKTLQLSLGYSHDVNFAIPEGIAIVTPKPTEVTITGIDKRVVGQVAAEIRAFRPPEPYKARASNMPANSSSVRKARRSN